MKPNAEDADIFARSGLLPMRGWLPRKPTALAKDAILNELTRLKLRVNGKFVSSKIQDLPIFQQTGRMGQMVGGLDEVDRLFTDELLETMESLAGANLKRPSTHAQILLSFPHKVEWSLDQLNWHLDLAPPKTDFIPGVQAFLLLDDLQPQGGSTLALAGSNKLHHVQTGKNAHDILRGASDFQKNPEKFLKPQLIEGHQVQIVEMSGRAGDVFLMDLRVLHTPSVNARKNLRMMATHRFLR